MLEAEQSSSSALGLARDAPKWFMTEMTPLGPLFHFGASSASTRGETMAYDQAAREAATRAEIARSEQARKAAQQAMAVQRVDKRK